MKRILPLIFLLPAAATASVDLDQYEAGWHNIPLSLGGDSEQRLAQTFKAGLSGRLDHVDLVMQCAPDSPGSVTVGIHHLDASGHPLASAINSVTVAANTLDTGPDFGILSFDIPGVGMTAGESYAVVMDGADGAQCTVPEGPVEGSMFSYPRGEALYWALPNPPQWYPFIPQARDLPFWTYVDTGHPTGPRYCDFKDASGVANDWLPAHVPICGCLEDAVTRANRCWFQLPEMTVWREFPLPLPDHRGRARYGVLPLTSGLNNLRIEEVGTAGDLVVSPVTFNKQLSPGKTLAKKARLRGQSEGTLFNIRYNTPKGDVEAVFETRVAIPQGGQ